jgi:hypothetical protein
MRSAENVFTAEPGVITNIYANKGPALTPRGFVPGLPRLPGLQVTPFCGLEWQSG